MKKTILEIAIFLLNCLLFLIYYITTAVFFFAPYTMLVNFQKINAVIGLIFVLSISLIISIVLFAYQKKAENSEKESKLKNWFHHNSQRLLLLYLFFILFFISLKPQIIWTYEEVKSIVSLEWTIMGLSLTIFLVWEVFIKEYIKAKRPQIAQTPTKYDRFKFIKNKYAFYEIISKTSTSITLITVNLVALILLTYITYIALNNEVTIFVQSLTLFVFCICTNTLIDLFFGIVRPVNEDKDQLLKESTVTNEDIDFQNKFYEDFKRYTILVEELDEIKSLTEKEKEQLKTEALLNLMGVEKVKRTESLSENNKHDKQE